MVALAVRREPAVELRHELSSLVVAEAGTDPAEVAVLCRQLRPVRRSIRSGPAATKKHGLDGDEAGGAVRVRGLLGIAELPERPGEGCPFAPSTTPIASRGAANHGFSAGDAHRAVTIRPPGSSTRRRSPRVAAGSAAAITASRLTTASNDASANGTASSKSASTSVSGTPASPARRRATSS